MASSLDFDEILNVTRIVDEGTYRHRPDVSDSSILPDFPQHVLHRTELMNWELRQIEEPSPSSTHSRSPSSSVARSSSFGSASDQSTQFTIPSRRSQLPRDVVDMIVGRIPTGNEIILPCEFAIYSDCGQTFTLDDTQRWMDHIIDDHLHNQIPIKSVCWFCDDFCFYADERGIDKRLNFLDRLEHISDHIREAHLGIEQVRPDFHFLDHLHRHNLISEHLFNMARSWEGESPAPEISGIYAPDSVPVEPAMARSQLVINSEPRRSRHSRGSTRTPQRRSTYFNTN